MERTEIIPAQERGGHTGASAKAELPSRHEAILLFNEAKRRLLNVNRWDELCGKGSAIFRLTNEQGNPLEVDAVEKNMYIRIELPGVAKAPGDGFDWVKVEELEHIKNVLRDEEVFGFRVRPAKSPVTGSNETAHFFTKGATSTFLIERKTNTVKALEKGRNETPNTWPSSWLSKLRNFLIGTGAMLGFAVPQWKSLVNGLLKGNAK